MAVIEFELTDMSAFEEQFRTDDSGGGGKKAGNRPVVTYPGDDSGDYPKEGNADSPEGKKNGGKNQGVASIAVAESVGISVLEEDVYELEERWLRGMPLSRSELELLGEIEEDLRQDYAH